MTLTPSQNGFIKGMGLAVLSAASAFLANPDHLTIFSATTALIVSGIASMVESYVRDQTGEGLLGAVKVR